MTHDEQRALLVAFAEWYGQAYAANFIPKGTIDAFLSTRQPPGEPVITLGCEHGRLPGHPCPHCMGINTMEVTAPPTLECPTCHTQVDMLIEGKCRRCAGMVTGGGCPTSGC